MKRVALTEIEEKGYWFDAEKAEAFDEETYHDGHNWISKATGSQWHHEKLFLTASGKWIKSIWSNMQGSTDRVETITAEEAAVWFLSQEKELPKSLENFASKYEI